MPIGLGLGLSLIRGNEIHQPLAGLVAPFNPLVVLEARLLSSLFQDAAKTTPVTASGNPVGNWVDQITGKEFSQSTDANRPLWKIINGYPCVEADGANDYLGPALFTVSQQWWMFAVISSVTWTSGERIVAGGDTVAGMIYQTGTSPDVAIHSGSALAATGEPALGTPFILSALHNGVSSSVRINNGTPVTGNAGTNVPGGMTLFASHTGGSAGNSRIYVLAAGLGALPPFSAYGPFLANTYGVAL